MIFSILFISLIRALCEKLETAFTWAISNTIQDVTVQIYEVATGAMIMADVTVSTTQVTITIVDSTGAGTLAANTYKAVIIG